MATVDHHLFVRHPVFNHDAVNVVDEAVRTPGGKGLVAAAAARQSGMDVELLALVGVESEILGLLPCGVDSRRLLACLDGDTQVWMSIADEVVVTWVQPGRILPRTVDLRSVTAAFIADIDGLYISMEDLSLIEAALRGARQRGLPVAANLCRPLLDQTRRARSDLVARLIEQCDILLMNRGEADEVGMLSLEPGPRPQEIVITEGPRGGRYRDRTGRWSQFDAEPVAAVRSVVGAGDAFNGAFIASRWWLGADLEQSCRRAALAAAAVVQVATTIVPTRR